MKLFDGVEILEATHGGRPVQLTLLTGATRTVLMDAGTPQICRESVLPALAGLGRRAADVDVLLITHADVDHFGGAAALREAGCRLVVCPEADRAMIEDPQAMIALRSDRWGRYGIHAGEAGRQRTIELTGGGVKADFSVRGGEAIRLADDWVVHVVATPGHTPGHVGVHDPKHRAFYGGDAIHGAVYPGRDGTAKLPPTYEYVDDYLATIARIEAPDLDVYVGCHWPVSRGRQIAAFCAESRRFVQRAEAAILEAVRSGQAHTLGALVERLGPKLGDWPRDRDRVLVAPFSGHLDRLVARGALTAEPREGILHYHA
jgi:glyoxylase-like metal-dependent hydrolase (beta-lactamase superfamily II)